ncbi:borealin-like isoform X2 [Musca domestica]|uniref:Borealin isoform X2 n=1 Tax=Musca domestica TaxID=7370 RepID=A0A1I8MA74_MUSDO|nr:borealin isoform X2 [Musca domestica]XP_058979586.1 borealin-like isoform X2 [Musca domestica]
MPRTKVSKSSKRNREEAVREEKIREFENTLEGFQNNFDVKVQDYVTSFEQRITMLLQKTSTALLQMKICDVFDMDLEKFADWDKKMKLRNEENMSNSTLLRSAKITNPNDEEDSSTSASLGSSTTNAAYLNSSAMRTQQLPPHQSARLRTPGPLSSARARRPRRSRSACGDYGIPGSAMKSKTSSQLSINAGSSTASDHHSRSKMRTPMASRSKALSADRSTKDANEPQSPLSPPTFLRFPRAGELVLSKCGSPLVANTVPGTFAHLNIPLRNGVISMRPKKIDDLTPDIIKAMDPETLQQLKTLHANIDKIVNMADKAGFF